MTILDDIQSNAIDTLYLSSVPEDYFAQTKDLVEVLEGNTSLTRVFFEKDFLGCLYGSERGQILTAVANLANLHELQLADVCLMASILVQLIQTTNKKGGMLNSITLERMVLQGVQADFDDLEAALLQKQPGLKAFRIHDCVAANTGIDLEKIIKAGNKSVNNPTNNGVIANPDQKRNSAIAA